MPSVAKRLHYRLIDVSSFKEIFRDKYNVSFEKKNAHRAVDDIYESIRELSSYLSYVKVTPETPPWLTEMTEVRGKDRLSRRSIWILLPL